MFAMVVFARRDLLGPGHRANEPGFAHAQPNSESMTS